MDSICEQHKLISAQFQGGRHGKGYGCILSHLLAVVNILSWGEVSLQQCVGEAGLCLGWAGLGWGGVGVLYHTEAGLKRAGTMLSRLSLCQLCASKLPLVPVLLLPPVLLLGAFGNTAPVWSRGTLHALLSGLNNHLLLATYVEVVQQKSSYLILISVCLFGLEGKLKLFSCPNSSSFCVCF